MELKELSIRNNINSDNRLHKKLNYLKKLLLELSKKDLPSDIVGKINSVIEELNSFTGSNNALGKKLLKSKIYIIRLVEKELKLVPKNLYLIRWMAIGMSVFGVPMGVSFGMALSNMAFLGIGIPIGMVLGLAIGSAMDKTAADNQNLQPLNKYFKRLKTIE
ncbi:hypothetical protein [Carboxylicivirga caseinilyticus]|uniref:hypothetical protein n=1 Tax=Carboxylicivirga caseinilyticus TaxID=3417572 RepID=UPI003D339CC6|nr:hypothetical protein [Marinilabiliaceae bacterium A049]